MTDRPGSDGLEQLEAELRGALHAGGRRGPPRRPAR